MFLLLTSFFSAQAKNRAARKESVQWIEVVADNNIRLQYFV
jgi:hypothetical protein